LWEEIFVCTQNNFTYSDVLMMPTNERRFYLGMLLKIKQREREMYENSANNNTGGKGNRKKTISGDQLKAQIKSGNVPLQ
jgi:hypothetical protein